MPLLDTIKQQVLSLGRSEARAKARPLLIDDESFERSAAGLDQRSSESFVLFWLLSDRALYLVAGGSNGDWAYRIPYGCIDQMSLDFDDNATTLPWRLQLDLTREGPGTITTLADHRDPGKPLAAPSPRIVEAEERERLACGEIIPMTGFAVTSRNFRSTLAHQLVASQGTLHLHGEERAEAQRKLRLRMRARKTG